MKRILVSAFVASTVVGCASSAEIREHAYAHLAKAHYLEAHGDYYMAARERAAADKQFAKARRRAYDEAYNRPYWY